FISSKNSVCLKAPWSSSGRGVIFSDQNSREKILQWASGFLKTQGGVMGEFHYNKRIDFASEWLVAEDEITFRGLSLFQSDAKGKYLGNRLMRQADIERLLKAESKWKDEILICQRDFISKYISPHYRGPLGFDMLVTDKGDVNPCVEINLRQTMGHVAIEVEKQMNDSNKTEIAYCLKKYFPDGVFSVNNFI
ncbi:MAG: hypothetical protein K2K81_03930, partial [Muribaculaceae bacterium]|nr:hypothetical protein [Muribaculaceae bacterium]